MAISATPINLPDCHKSAQAASRYTTASSHFPTDISHLDMNATYFLSRDKNVLSLEDSSRKSLSAGWLVGGVDKLGVPGLVLGAEVAGVAKGVFDVEVIITIWEGFWAAESAGCAGDRGEVFGFRYRLQSWAG